MCCFLGAWKDDDRNGEGTLTYAHGDKYEGNFDKGKREGRGKYTFHGGSTKIGIYKNDVRIKDEPNDVKQRTDTTSNQSNKVNGDRFIGIEELSDH